MTETQDSTSKAPPENPLAFAAGIEDGAYWQRGMTLRDYFAAHAPELSEVAWAGISQEAGRQGVFLQNLATVLAGWSYAYADAMLAERSKGAQ